MTGTAQRRSTSRSSRSEAMLGLGIAAGAAGLALASHLLARRARQSSKQNSFMSIPLLLIMISNHYPTISYGSKHSVWYLAGYLLLGWVGAKIVRDGVEWPRSHSSTK